MTLSHLTDAELSQLEALLIEDERNGRNSRSELVLAHGYDTKSAYHCIRLCLQAEQVLVEHDLDLERNSEFLKSVRRGEWTLPQIEDWFNAKERGLNELYTKSTLRSVPDEDSIKQLLLQCLESHFGNLDSAISRDTDVSKLLTELESMISKYRGSI